MATDENTEGHKVIVVGGPKVGKTSLIQRFLFNEFNIDVPSMTKDEMKIVSLRSGSISLLICDMADRTDIVTRKYYMNTEAVIFVYDITNPKTLLDSEIWIRDLRIYLNEELSKGLPVLFVGNKLDKVNRDIDHLISIEQGSDDPQAQFVTLNQTRAITDREGFLRPLECSALTGEGVNQVFECIASVLLTGHIGKCKSWCTLI